MCKIHMYKNIKEGEKPLSKDTFQNGKNSYLWIVGPWVIYFLSCTFPCVFYNEYVLFYVIRKK